MYSYPKCASLWHTSKTHKNGLSNPTLSLLHSIMSTLLVTKRAVFARSDAAATHHATFIQKRRLLKSAEKRIRPESGGTVPSYALKTSPVLNSFGHRKQRRSVWWGRCPPIILPMSPLAATRTSLTCAQQPISLMSIMLLLRRRTALLYQPSLRRLFASVVAE